MQLAIRHAADDISRQAYEGRLAFLRLELRKAIRLLTTAVNHRPNDEQAWQALMRAAAMASDRASLSFVQARMLDLSSINPEYAGIAALAAFAMNEPRNSASVARAILRAHGSHREVVYQAHRLLLWAGHAAEAAVLLPSMVDDDWYPTARLRQACADGDRELAEQIERSEYIIVGADWHRSMYLGNGTAAQAVLESIPDQTIPFTMASWLLYPQFDPSPFTELLALMERENIQRPPPARIPFTCPPE
jgi:hypothetical protein